MRLFCRLPCLPVTLFLLAGCAAHRVTEPAKVIGSEIANFQSGLSSFQDGMQEFQDDERIRIAGTATRRDIAIAATKQLQVEWAIIHAKSEGEVLAALQSLGHDEIVELAPSPSPTPQPTVVGFPLDELGAVATTMDQLSQQPDPKADLEFLLHYGTEVNKQL